VPDKWSVGKVSPANNFDVKWVMSQVGHADSKMTLDVYAQLEQRVKRDHGASFDRLIRHARDLHGRRTDGVRGLAIGPELVLARKSGRFGSTEAQLPSTENAL
jgi:hypothetical protein